MRVALTHDAKFKCPRVHYLLFRRGVAITDLWNSFTAFSAYPCLQYRLRSRFFLAGAEDYGFSYLG